MSRTARLANKTYNNNSSNRFDTNTYNDSSDNNDSISLLILSSLQNDWLPYLNGTYTINNLLLSKLSECATQLQNNIELIDNYLLLYDIYKQINNYKAAKNTLIQGEYLFPNQRIFTHLLTKYNNKPNNHDNKYNLGNDHPLTDRSNIRIPTRLLDALISPPHTHRVNNNQLSYTSIQSPISNQIIQSKLKLLKSITKPRTIHNPMLPSLQFSPNSPNTNDNTSNNTSTPPITKHLRTIIAKTSAKASSNKKPFNTLPLLQPLNHLQHNNLESKQSYNQSIITNNLTSHTDQSIDVKSNSPSILHKTISSPNATFRYNTSFTDVIPNDNQVLVNIVRNLITDNTISMHEINELIVSCSKSSDSCITPIYLKQLFELLISSNNKYISVRNLSIDIDLLCKYFIELQNVLVDCVKANNNHSNHQNKYELSFDESQLIIHTLLASICVYIITNNESQLQLYYPAIKKTLAACFYSSLEDINNSNHHFVNHFNQNFDNILNKIKDCIVSYLTDTPNKLQLCNVLCVAIQQNHDNINSLQGLFIVARDNIQLFLSQSSKQSLHISKFINELSTFLSAHNHNRNELKSFIKQLKLLESPGLLNNNDIDKLVCICLQYNNIDNNTHESIIYPLQQLITNNNSDHTISFKNIDSLIDVLYNSQQKQLQYNMIKPLLAQYPQLFESSDMIDNAEFIFPEDVFPILLLNPNTLNCSNLTGALVGDHLFSLEIACKISTIDILYLATQTENNKLHLTTTQINALFDCMVNNKPIPQILQLKLLINELNRLFGNPTPNKLKSPYISPELFDNYMYSDGNYNSQSSSLSHTKKQLLLIENIDIKDQQMFNIWNDIIVKHCNKYSLSQPKPLALLFDTRYNTINNSFYQSLIREGKIILVECDSQSIETDHPNIYHIIQQNLTTFVETVYTHIHNNSNQTHNHNTTIQNDTTAVYSNSKVNLLATNSFGKAVPLPLPIINKTDNVIGDYHTFTQNDRKSQQQTITHHQPKSNINNADELHVINADSHNNSTIEFNSLRARKNSISKSHQTELIQFNSTRRKNTNNQAVANKGITHLQSESADIGPIDLSELCLPSSLNPNNNNPANDCDASCVSENEVKVDNVTVSSSDNDRVGTERCSTVLYDRVISLSDLLCSDKSDIVNSAITAANAYNSDMFDEYACFRIELFHVDRVGKLNNTRPYVTIYRERGHIWELSYKSEVVVRGDTINPKFERIIIKLQALCNNEYNRKIKISLNHDDRENGQLIIGEVITCWNEIINNMNTPIYLSRHTLNKSFARPPNANKLSHTAINTMKKGDSCMMLITSADIRIKTSYAILLNNNYRLFDFNSHCYLRFNIIAKDLPKLDILGLSDPFFELYTYNNYNNQPLNSINVDVKCDNNWCLAYKSEIIENCLDPIFAVFVLPASIINNNYNTPLLFRVYDYDRVGSPTFMGSIINNLYTLLNVTIGINENDRNNINGNNSYSLLDDNKKPSKGFLIFRSVDNFTILNDIDTAANNIFANANNKQIKNTRTAYLTYLQFSTNSIQSQTKLKKPKSSSKLNQSTPFNYDLLHQSLTSSSSRQYEIYTIQFKCIKFHDKQLDGTGIYLELCSWNNNSWKYITKSSITKLMQNSTFEPIQAKAKRFNSDAINLQQFKFFDKPFIINCNDPPLLIKCINNDNNAVLCYTIISLGKLRLCNDNKNIEMINKEDKCIVDLFIEKFSISTKTSTRRSSLSVSQPKNSKSNNKS